MSADSWPSILLSALAIACATILTLIQRRLAGREQEDEDARADARTRARTREERSRFHER